MQKVKVTLWELTPEEIVQLPKGTQVIEYCTRSGRMRVKERGKTPAYDFSSCIYLLASPSKEEPASYCKHNKFGYCEIFSDEFTRQPCIESPCNHYAAPSEGSPS